MTRFVLTGLLALIGVYVWSGSGALVAQSPTADPWRQVPPLPATCYQSEDFSAPAGKASEALGAAIARQDAINAEIEKEFHEMDMAEMAQRMQAFMLKDPQRAAEVLGAMNTAGAAATETVQRAARESEPLEKELKGLTAKFQAAVDGVRKPIEAQIQQLMTKTLPAHGDAIYFATPAEEAQYLGLQARLNTDYDKICGAWWGPKGSFQTWLQNYRTYLVDNVIPTEDQVAAAKALQFAIMETPSGGYRSTSAMKGVQEFLVRAGQVYALRPHRLAVGKPGDHYRP
jgi:hypothetical protein